MASQAVNPVPPPLTSPSSRYVTTMMKYLPSSQLPCPLTLTNGSSTLVLWQPARRRVPSVWPPEHPGLHGLSQALLLPLPRHQHKQRRHLHCLPPPSLCTWHAIAAET